METKPKDVKEKILAAARTLFAKQGFEATSVRQICGLAEVNQALVSYYFGGKENLYFAVLDEAITIPSDLGLPGLADLTASSVLRVLIAEIVRWRLRNPEIIRIVQREMMSENDRLSELIPRVRSLWDFVRSILIAGRDKGEFSFQSSDYALLFVMGGLMYPDSYPLHQLLRTETPLSETVLIEETYRFILGGLGCRVATS